MSLEIADPSVPTEVGSYFVSNYPPFSQWKRELVPEFLERLDRPADTDVPLGLYLHIPFCRKRCKFCYFRVYTDQNAKAIEEYVQGLIREVELMSTRPVIAGRPLKFVYFGGGTPSYLGARQLRSLYDRLNALVSWDKADEVTFECEPGTLSLDKVKTLRDIGVTRVSLGVENFDDKILEANGRAHLSPEVARAYEWIRESASAGEYRSDRGNDRRDGRELGTLHRAGAGDGPRQHHHLSDGTAAQHVDLQGNQGAGDHVADRRLADEAAVGGRGDQPLVRRGIPCFERQRTRPQSGLRPLRVSRQRVARLRPDGDGRGLVRPHPGWHCQNLDRMEDYLAALREGRLPTNRALQPTAEQLLIREFVLQLKEGRASRSAFQAKFGVDVVERFRERLERQRTAGYLDFGDEGVSLTRKGLLQVDSLLWEYFEPEFRQVRYT